MYALASADHHLIHFPSKRGIVEEQFSNLISHGLKPNRETFELLIECMGGRDSEGWNAYLLCDGFGIELPWVKKNAI